LTRKSQGLGGCDRTQSGRAKLKKATYLKIVYEPNGVYKSVCKLNVTYLGIMYKLSRVYKLNSVLVVD
jgi:hypothetical protein